MKFLALAVALALGLFTMSQNTATVHADNGCEDGNTPNVIQIQHGIYTCRGEVSDLFPFGHVFEPHLAGATACVERLQELDVNASAAFFGVGVTGDGDLVSSFCQDLLYVGDGPFECSYWSGAGGNDQGYWPEANFEACAQWAAVAFSPYSAEAGAVDAGDGTVCTALNGCARIYGAQADNPIAPDQGEFVQPGSHPDPHEFVDQGFGPESVGGTPAEDFEPTGPLAPTLVTISPPSAGGAGLFGTGSTVEASLVALSGLLLAYAAMGLGIVVWRRML